MQMFYGFQDGNNQNNNLEYCSNGTGLLSVIIGMQVRFDSCKAYYLKPELFDCWTILALILKIFKQKQFSLLFIKVHEKSLS